MDDKGKERIKEIDPKELEAQEAEEKAVKYTLILSFEVDGIVEKSDIIGAIFGQTEGILGSSFDLRELQRTGKIGRIIVTNIESKERKTTGLIKVNVNKEIEVAALIAALIESVDQVGPYKATIRLKQLIDVREKRINEIVKRASEILENWKVKKVPLADEIIETLRKKLQSKQLKTIVINGEELAAGPDVEKSDEVILVEGRADVLNLMKYGITNALSIGGGKIPEEIKDLIKGKKVTVFIDGDRSGILNLKKLMQTIRIDYVATAPPNKEVEELKGEEIMEALANRKPINVYLVEENEELKSYKDYILQVAGTLQALLIKDGNVVLKVPVSELVEQLEKYDGEIDTIVFDGIITQRLIDIASVKNVKTIVGLRKASSLKEPSNIKILAYRNM
ncbi:MAG: DNA primase DnaG [Candidatus Geothermarchaeota archaeon]